MKKSKIIVPALGLIALSTAASITGTVAWFTANNSVTITGMSVKTNVASNLFIAGDTLGSVAKKVDSDFGPGPLEQEALGILEPVSTLNGKDFFYSVNAKADGSYIPVDGASNDFIAYDPSTAATDTTNYSNKFSEDYGLTKSAAAALVTGQQGALAYVDNVFQLKATNSSGAVQHISLTELKLKYSGATDENVAYRVGVFFEDISSANPAGGAGTLKGTYKPSAAANHGGKVVSAVETLSDASYVTSAVSMASLTNGTTGQYKVVVRLWLEGQDTTCTNSTFAALTGSWALSMKFGLVADSAGAPASGVTALTMEVTA